MVDGASKGQQSSRTRHRCLESFVDKGSLCKETEKIGRESVQTAIICDWRAPLISGGGSGTEPSWKVPVWTSREWACTHLLGNRGRVLPSIMRSNFSMTLKQRGIR